MKHFIKKISVISVLVSVLVFQNAIAQVSTRPVTPENEPIVITTSTTRPVTPDNEPEVVLPPTTRPVTPDNEPEVVLPPTTRPVTPDNEPEVVLPPTTRPVTPDNEPEVVLPPTTRPVTPDNEPEVVLPPTTRPVTPDNEPEVVLPPTTRPVTPDNEPVIVFPGDEDDNKDEETPTVINQSFGRGGSSGSRINFAPVANLSAGEVLGATTDDSCKMLTTFMKQGMTNSVEEVMMLQTFLNTLGANLPVTGFFGPLTEQAVKNFQLQYSEQILAPWVNLGLHSSSTVATGYVYKTTQYVMNKMMCPNVEIAAPVLN